MTEILSELENAIRDDKPKTELLKLIGDAKECIAVNGVLSSSAPRVISEILPKQIEILKVLRDKSKTKTELCETLNMNQAEAQLHLSNLLELGCVSSSDGYTESLYRLQQNGILALSECGLLSGANPRRR